MVRMFRPSRAVLVALLLMTAGLPALAAGPDAPATTAGVQMLARAHQAARMLAYSGTYVHQRGPEVHSLRLTHQRSGAVSVAKLESLDGPPSETLRRGEHLQTYLPQQRRIVVQDREEGPAFPGLRLPDPVRLAAHYQLRRLGDEQVAGRPAAAWALEPRDALRYGYRFWADRASGLLLRVQTLSEKAEVVEQAAFTQVSFGPQPPARLKASVQDTRGWRTDDATGHPVDAAGWQVGALPPGFERQGSWLRVLGPAGGRADGGREVLQLLYSDGLAGLSVFIEPWSAERSARPLQFGALNMVGKRHGKFWLTIVGEVPMLAIRQVADAIEFTDTSRK